MAERPIFIPSTHTGRLVDEKLFSFEWSPGLAPGQKKKNVAALHESAAKAGYVPLLEVSTKSDEPLGQRLSAFNLKVELQEGGSIPLECAFQGSKVFEQGGPFNDLFLADARQAKRDPRLVESGRLKGFFFEGQEFPLVPKTAFYDWIYIRSLYPHREYLKRLSRYQGFTDIEFNPDKSINCQARSCATLVALERRGLLDECMESSEAFINVLLPDSLQQPHSDNLRQRSLL
jgi:hypothetical protein